MPFERQIAASTLEGIISFPEVVSELLAAAVDFTRRAMEAGTQGYFAFLRGKRVTYIGRQGDQHTEWFPGTARAAVDK